MFAYSGPNCSRHYVPVIGMKEPLSSPIKESDFIFVDVADGKVEQMVDCDTEKYLHPDAQTVKDLHGDGNGRFLLAGMDTVDWRTYGFQVFVLDNNEKNSLEA